MKFTLTRSAVLGILQQALKTCDTSKKELIDSEFMFEEEGGSLWVSSLNDSAEQRILLPVTEFQAEDKEAFTVEGQKVVTFVNGFSHEEIKCLFDGSALIMGKGKSKYAWPTGNAEQFVPFNYSSPFGRFIEVNGSSLSDALRMTAFAASTDDAEAPKTAVRLTVKGIQLIAEATDEYRISRYNFEVEDTNADGVEMLIPREAAFVLSGLLKKIQSVRIEPGARHHRFLWGDTTLTVRDDSIPGREFPEVMRFMDGARLGRVKISKGDFQKALKLAETIAKDSYIILQTQEEGGGEDGGIIISIDEAGGVGQDLVIAQEVEGEAATCLPFKHLEKAVSNAESPFVELEFREVPNVDEAAFLINDGAWEHLIFPVAPNDVVADDDEEE